MTKSESNAEDTLRRTLIEPSSESPSESSHDVDQERRRVPPRHLKGLRPSLESSILAPETVLFGYEVLEFVGEGAWSYVYKAQHPKLPMHMAIKQLKPEWAKDDVALQRFLREANIVAGLRHPNVVRIYDLKHDEETDLYYIITEFAQRGTLADRLSESPEGLPVDEVLRLAMGICSGLAAAHRKEVVHRDIKPSNVLLFDVGESWDMPKLSDFGLAKAPAIEGLEVPKSSGVYGSLYYMSPEQLDSDIEVDRRSDLYSLGVLLYELLTGQVPFVGEFHDVFWGHMYLSPKSLKEFKADISEALEQVVLRALRKAPEDRYQSAIEMHQALENILDTSIRRERQRRFDGLLEQGLAYLQEEEWEAAIETLSQASALEPENERVLDGLRRARERQEIERLYNLGIQYLENGNWEQASDGLAQVISYDLDYANGKARELLEEATQALKRKRIERDLIVMYRQGIGHFRKHQWAQAVDLLKQVVALDPAMEDAAERLRDASDYLRAERLFEEAQHHRRQGEWEEAVNLLEAVEQLAPPHIDVSEELKLAGRRQATVRQEQQLAALYEEGMVMLERGNLEQAMVCFQKTYERQPDYRNVMGRLQEIDQELKLRQLFAQASEYEHARNWDKAIEVYRTILNTDPYNRRAVRRLARAQRSLGSGSLLKGVAQVQNWWDRQNRRAQATLVVLLAILALFVGAALAGLISFPP